MTDKLQKYLESAEYLPDFLSDFHDQKDFFKAMHFLQDGNPGQENAPSWVDGHIYVIDRVLWFFASRGYTLQKCRKKDVEFKELPNWRKIQSEPKPKS